METYDNKLLALNWICFYWIPLFLCRKNLDHHLKSPTLLPVIISGGFFLLLTAWGVGSLYFVVTVFVMLSPVYFLAIRAMNWREAKGRKAGSINCGPDG